MRGRGVGVLFVGLLVAVVVGAMPQPAGATSPVVENVTWSPGVPAFGDNVTVEADVSDPDGLSVWVAWCTIPPWTCDLYDMIDPESDGHWVTDRPVRTTLNESYPSAYVNVTALDSYNNLAFSPKYYVQLANDIAVDATLTPADVAPGQGVQVSGVATYEGNASAPAAFSAVQFQILENGITHASTTDSNGAFTWSFTAPSTIGSYTVVVEVSNRTISGSQSKYLVVATQPTPDLALVPGSLSLSPNPATPGEQVTASFQVENRGNGDATSFDVRLSVLDGTSTVLFSHTFPALTLAPMETVELERSWTAGNAPVTVRIEIDSAGTVAELSETNNDASAPLTMALNPDGGFPAILMVGGVLAGVGVAAGAVLVLRRRARGPR